MQETYFYIFLTVRKRMTGHGACQYVSFGLDPLLHCWSLQRFHACKIISRTWVPAAQCMWGWNIERWVAMFIRLRFLGTLCVLHIWDKAVPIFRSNVALALSHFGKVQAHSCVHLSTSLFPRHSLCASYLSYILFFLHSPLSVFRFVFRNLPSCFPGYCGVFP